MMYFYKIAAAGYEESYQTIYYSDKKITQKEFEDIVFDIYHKMCQDIVNTEPTSLCYCNIYFNADDIFFDYKGNFKKEMEKLGFYELNKKVSCYMFFDLCCDNFFTKIYRDIDNTYEKRMRDILSNLDIDESCYYNNCSRLDDEEEKEWVKQDCFIHRLQGNRIKNKNCNNCSHPYMSCDENGFCEGWRWNGDRNE